MYKQDLALDNLQYITQLPWWLIILIILLSGLFGPRVFQLAVKFAKMFERKYKSNWKVQESAPWPGYSNCDSTLED